MKKQLRILFNKFLKVIARLVYPEAQLEGKYFTPLGAGWYWISKGLWFQKILGFNRHLPFPAAPNIYISNYKNLIIGKDNLNNFQSFGIYFQNFSAKIILEDEVYIGPNVGIITANHDFSNLDIHLPGKEVKIGSKSWIGMNSVILPGVELGPRTVVGAGSVVTKSFSEGNVVIAGNPAKIIKVNPI